MPTICFCAIFRNESRNVRRCLDAAKPVIDYLAVCDTGSTDDTMEQVERWGRAHGVPTQVSREPFRNFGYNRTLSVDLAKRAFPAADYLLLLDADMVLKMESGWDKAVLTEDHYLIRQVNPFIEYWNTRLIRAALPWICTGVTHEYWECQRAAPPTLLKSLWIDDREDGGYKADKFERDQRLLTEAIHDAKTPEPLRARYCFYLAQTYRDLHQPKAALRWYERRVNAGGWAEEVYVAQCEKANLTIQLGFGHNEIVAEHLKAYSLRPSRAEALWQLAAYCRERQRYAEGYLFAKVGKDIPLPDDILFVRREVYEWRLLDEFAICAYWIGQYQESADASRRILREGLYEPAHKNRLEVNLGYALEKR